MKFVAFKFDEDDAKFRVGFLTSHETVFDASRIYDENGLNAWQINDFLDTEQSYFNDAARSVRDVALPEISLADVILCAPVPRPGKVICIGLNYRNHAIESGMDIPALPIVFSKFSSCVVGPGDEIEIPADSTQTDFEAELVVVIGRRARNISCDAAYDHVLGYTNMNDVSARDLQFTDGQWQRGKSCETFAPLGPFIACKDVISNPEDLRIQFRLNGETMQDSTTTELIFGIAELIEFLSKHITLEPGDVIATGTPPGVGFARKPPVYLKSGDICEVEIEGLGILKNVVK